MKIRGIVFALILAAPSAARGDVPPGPAECGGGLGEGEVCQVGEQVGLCRPLPYYKGGLRLQCDLGASTADVATAGRTSMYRWAAGVGCVLLVGALGLLHRRRRRRDAARWAEINRDDPA